MLLISVNLLEVIMVKKFSYLVSVSILASSLLSSASHAVYDDELRDVINGFRTSQSRATPSSAPATSSSSSDDKSSWWSSTYAVGSSVLSGTGHSLRWAGDYMRGTSPISNLLVNNTLSLAGTAEYRGMSAATLLNAVKADPSSLESLQKTTANTLRYVGTLMAGETPTLERTIRQFWIDKRVADNPEEAFISTACALYRAEQLSGVDEIKLNYRKFIESWNNSSYTIPSHDVERNVEYFLKGIIRGFVMNNQSMSSFDSIAPQMAALGITYENLPATKVVTADSVIPDVNARGLLTPVALKEQVDKVRQEAFMGFVTDTYKIEALKKQADQVRQLSIQVPSTLPTSSKQSSLLMIEHQREGERVEEVD